MKRRLVIIGGLILFLVSSIAHSQRLSGNTFLPPELMSLGKDEAANPLSLWNDQGHAIWEAKCQECHGKISSLATTVVQFPKWISNSTSQGRLLNLEDQIGVCLSRTSTQKWSNESNEVLALSTALSDTAKGQKIRIEGPKAKSEHEAWQEQMNLAAKIYVTRQGRLNLACTQCHDQKIGIQLRSDVISPAFVTVFPIYRQSWQTAGSIDRRLRACYSGVQALVPPSGSPELRALELFLKKRSEGMPWDGPSIRR